jgi:hypothetical protein
MRWSGVVVVHVGGAEMCASGGGARIEFMTVDGSKRGVDV